MKSQPKLFSIVFEDAGLLVLNKRALCHSTSLKDSTDPSIASELAELYPDLIGVSENAGEAGLIQRLDFETSGLLLAAKTRDAWYALKDQMKSATIKKEYLILVEGRMAGSLSCDGWIGSRYRGSKKVTVYPSKQPRTLPASTEFHKVRSVGHFALVRAECSAARRHQVRAHSAFLGHPLVGDSLYGATSQLAELGSEVDKDVPSFLLHAAKISFENPVGGSLVEFEAALPEYMQVLVGA